MRRSRVRLLVAAPGFATSFISLIFKEIFESRSGAVGSMGLLGAFRPRLIGRLLQPEWGKSRVEGAIDR